MSSNPLYDQYLQFPLFMGMSRDDLSQIAGHTKFDFQKIGPRVLFIREGSPCTHLYFLLSGSVFVETHSDDGSYRLVEQLTAPLILQPEVIFGYRQRYTHYYRAATSLGLLRIDRQEIVRLTEQFLIFRINLLNLLSTQVQKLLHQPWRRRPDTLDDRIIQFVSQRCTHPAGPKTLYIHMVQLAEELGDSRLEISRALNRLQKDGLVTLHRGRIEIPQMELLIANR